MNSFVDDLREYLASERSEKALDALNMIRAGHMNNAAIQAGYVQALESIDEWVIDYFKRRNSEGA